jgi:dihydroorotase-like cyclic amidohydrolase
MRFDTIIQNGTIVTATDTTQADVGIVGDKVSAIAAQLPAENASQVIDAANHLLLPGGIDVHTHLDMPFGGTTSADDFQTGTTAAAFGGTTTLIDFAIQYKGQTLRQAFDTWMKKAHDKAVIDFAFHCIITDLGSAQLEEMGQLIREGVTSFKLFMAYPGVFMLDDATIFRAMRQAAKHSGLVCMHAENGGAIDVIVQQALAEGKRARPKPKPPPAPSHLPKWPARRCTSSISLAMTPSKKFAKPVIAACPPTPKRVRNISICRLKTWMLPASRARNMCSLRLCAKNGIRKSSGKVSRMTRSKLSPPITARFASRNRKN